MRRVCFPVQVKYFRRSIHEVNSLVNDESGIEEGNNGSVTDKLSENQMDSMENFDSLEADAVYENVELGTKKSKDLDVQRGRMHDCEPKKLEIAPEAAQELPVCSKCLPAESVRQLTDRFEKTKDDAPADEPKRPKSYDKDGLPPCLRAKNAKNSVKTKSLDENAFVTEFARGQLTRRKSLDDRTSSYINSKLLIEPPKPPSRSTLDVSQIDAPKTEPEQKLNRERIEKYKEERRNFLREKYRSESFREDKDKVLSRLKQKSFRKSEDTENKHDPKKLPAEAISKFEREPRPAALKKHSPLTERRNRADVKVPGEAKDEAGKEEEFIRVRRGDSESERKRHTFEAAREREFDSETLRRVSMESRNPR